MLPFGRMLEYGNIKPSTNERFKIYSASSAFYLHDTLTNKLYATSYATSGSGTGKREPKFVLSAINVKRIMLDDNSSAACIYERMDGRFFMTGTTRIMSGSNTTPYEVWTDITSFMNTSGVSSDDIAFMSSYYDYKINLVTKDGRLFCSGVNSTTTESSFGDGTNNPAVNTFRRITSISNVKYAVGNYYVLNDNRLYVTGTNSKYQYGDGTTSGGPSLKLITTDAKYVQAGYQNMYYINTKNELIVSGTQFGSAYGNEFGTGGTSSTPPVIYSTGTRTLNNVSALYACVGNMATHVVIGETLYSAGNNQLAQFGNGDLKPTYSYVTSLNGVKEGYQFCRANLGSLFMTNDGRLVYAGRDDLAFGGTGTQFITSFNVVPMDFIE